VGGSAGWRKSIREERMGFSMFKSDETRAGTGRNNGKELRHIGISSFCTIITRCPGKHISANIAANLSVTGLLYDEIKGNNY